MICYGLHAAPPVNNLGVEVRNYMDHTLINRRIDFTGIDVSPKRDRLVCLLLEGLDLIEIGNQIGLQHLNRAQHIS